MVGHPPSFVTGRRRLSLVIAICMLIPLFAGCTGLGGPPEPTARIKADREEINVGESVNFDARESTSPESTIITGYNWDFGDGTKAETIQGYTQVDQQSEGAQW